MICSVVVPAAGSGSRFGGEVPKQFALLGGRPLIAHALSRFESIDGVDDIVVAASADQLERVRAVLSQQTLRKCRVVEGGASRAESVLKGLDALRDSSGDAVVAIHDAVRPFVTAELFGRLLSAIEGRDGAFPGLPPIDTIHVIEDGLVRESPLREHLAGAQTPQLFRVEIVRRALVEAIRSGASPTDEVSAVARIGGRVALVEGDPRNFKITKPEDLVRAERILAGGGV